MFLLPLIIGAVNQLPTFDASIFEEWFNQIITAVFDGVILTFLETAFTIFFFNILDNFLGTGPNPYGIEHPLAWALLVILLMTSAGMLYYGVRE